MWGSKVGAVVLLASIGFFGAYIPIVLRKCKIERFVCILNTFAAGAFLGLALFHIMPEAAEMLEKAELYIYVGKLRTPFNVAFLLIFVGYVVILLCEQVLTLGGEHGDSPRSPRSGATTPRSLEGGWQGEERERGLRRDRTADDGTVEIKVVCAPAAEVATDDTRAQERRDATATGQAEAAIAAEGQGAAASAAAADASAEQGCTRALLGEALMGESAAVSAYDSSSSKREDVCVGEEVRGGGCGLGFPCCLMAEAAAREAAQQQGRDKTGRGATARAAGGKQARAEGEMHSEKTGEAGDSTSKERDAKGTRALVSGCCVLKQRQKHPRDSTRASAAGSDADDDDECSEVAAFVTTSQVAASGAREGMETFCLRQDCKRAGGLQHQRQKGQEGMLKEEGTVYDVEGRQSQEEEQQSSAVRGVGQMASACRALMPRPCGNGSHDGDSATMFHPAEGRVQSFSVSTCGDAAAGTREMACDAGNLEAGAGGAAGGPDAGGAGGTAAGGKDGFEMAVVVRDILERDKGAADLGGRLYEDSSRRASKPQQRGRLRRWCRGFWRRPRAAEVLQQHRQRQRETGEEERKRRGRNWLFWCRCCPARVLTCLIPFAKQLDGGAVFLMAALAIHGLFEGFVVGAENNLMSLWILTCVIGAHKWAESLLLMTQFMDRHLSMTWAWTLVTIFVASSPIGIIVGTCVSSESRVAAGVCNALGAGTLLFVAAEVSAQVFTGDRKHRLVQLLVYCAGAGMVLGLSLLDLALEPEA